MALNSLSTYSPKDHSLQTLHENCSLIDTDSTLQDSNSLNVTDHEPGSDVLFAISQWYISIHGYIAIIVCILGIIANLLNIIILTRRNMTSATNNLLSALAVSDGLTMLAYLPFAIRYYVMYGIDYSPERNTYGFALFIMFYACFSVVVHSVSIWLTVTLAIFRYLFIRYPGQGAQLCSLKRANLAIVLTYIITFIFCIPNFVTLKIIHMNQTSEIIDESSIVRNVSETLWSISFKKETSNEQFVYFMNFWIQAVIVKLIPCIALTVLSLLIVYTMKKVEKKRQLLFSKPKGESAKVEDDSGRIAKTNRTTRMLLAVVFLFLLTEFPQGILNMLCGIIPYFQGAYYDPLAEIVDILALINNGINFILYCTMSKQFRDTFVQVFLNRVRVRNGEFTLVPTTTRNDS